MMILGRGEKRSCAFVRFVRVLPASDSDCRASAVSNEPVDRIRLELVELRARCSSDFSFVSNATRRDRDVSFPTSAVLSERSQLEPIFFSSPFDLTQIDFISPSK